MQQISIDRGQVRGVELMVMEGSRICANVAVIHTDFALRRDKRVAGGLLATPFTAGSSTMKVMICPHCHSSSLSKNGHRYGKQRYVCKDYGKQFLDRHHVQHQSAP